jgi:hypothetical protein
MPSVQFTSGVSLNKTFFISIAAQDDEELKYTVKSIFENADFPDNVFVGIALTAMSKKSLRQATALTKKYNVEVDFVKQKRNNLSTLGIGKGRSRASKLYKDQDYMIQIDCHSSFDKSWDTTLVNLFNEAKKEVGDDLFVLSGIPLVYEYCCSKHEDPIKIGPASRYPYYVTEEFFVDVIPKWAEADISIVRKEKFLPATKVSPAFIMGNKKFAKDPGIYEKATFYDEDLTQTISLFSRNFAFVFPNVDYLPVRHLDSDGVVKGHDRFFILDYLDKENQDLLHANMRKEYRLFAKSLLEDEVFERYKKYAKVDLLKGCFTRNSNLVPESFRL